ncbi:OLC1v1019530C2 [Oldenlandia corymbosa var. corymbosa]|uniref:OLC1v1019530C2 n=1 Tax=Oldenlandia corymbosa var. corymbosa TaxID=529605 RepID=A0AAV1EEM6_OLDCO|nr:OLC1v1019530C2 [Oldenlandia corymbosa var. corymbosa]
MENRGRVIFLEEWLVQNSVVDDSIRSRVASSPSSRVIIRAWNDIRDALKSQSFDHHHLQFLKILCDSQSVLHVADPHAKLLVSILSLSDVSLPEESYPLFFRLLYIWVRKSSRQSSLIIDSVVEVLTRLFSERFKGRKNLLFFSEGIVLLGAISFIPHVSEKSRTVCLELLCKRLDEEYHLIGLSGGHMPYVLAGIGYALSSSGKIYFVRLLDFLFEMWEKKDGPCVSVSNGLMILHLIEWVLSNYVSSQANDKVNLLQSEVLGCSKQSYSLFALLMAAAGVLRFINRSGSNGFMDLRKSAEKLIETVARQLVSRIRSVNYSVIESKDSFLSQCLCVATARSGSISNSASLALCLAFALLGEVFPLRQIYEKILASPAHINEGSLLSDVQQHLSSVSFKEAGAMTGAFCNQYIAADAESKNIIEDLIWEYCQDIYFKHRDVALVLRDIKTQLLEDLEKIAESAFLMVVLFALAVAKYRLSPKLNPDANLKISVRILVSFSCMEYFRRIRLPEYMEAIRTAVVSVQESESACVAFVESMPSYNDLTRLKLHHTWLTDDVQTARILFYMRVIPTCIEHIPTTVFRKVVASTMFLYMGHTNVKVARASHSIFVAFISSGKESDQDDRSSLKEQLVFYYMQRSLEVPTLYLLFTYLGWVNDTTVCLVVIV